MIAGWKLLVYAIAGNAKERDALLASIDAMKDCLTSSQCNIAVQLMAPGETARFWITSTRKEAETLEKIADASKAETLTEFLKAAQDRFPSGSTALVLQAHGTGLDNVHDYFAKAGNGLGGLGGLEADRQSGASSQFDPNVALHQSAASRRRPRLGRRTELARTTCLDEQVLVEQPRRPVPIGDPGKHERYGCSWGPDPNSKLFLTNVAMRAAIKAADTHVDLLGLNSCWMATLEIEYELHDVAAVQVACQVYAKPWPYPAIVTALSKDPEQSNEQLARVFVAEVAKAITAGDRKDALSAVRSGPAMEELVNRFDCYAGRVLELIGLDWPGVCKAVMSKAQRIDDPHQVDLMSLISELGLGDEEAMSYAESVRAQFKGMLLENVTHPSHPGIGGLSIFCPKNTRVDLRTAYKGTLFEGKKWGAFLEAFQRKLAATPRSGLPTHSLLARAPRLA